MELCFKKTTEMKPINILAIAVAIVASAASAAPAVQSIDSLSTTDFGILSKRGYRCDDPPKCESFSHYPDALKRDDDEGAFGKGLNKWGMKRWTERPKPLLREAVPKQSKNVTVSELREYLSSRPKTDVILCTLD
jgi:hypothetical protein